MSDGATMGRTAGTDTLELRMLGSFEVRRRDEVVDLPRSKKTRALLAYLVVSGRGHNREQLCTLLWDATYDPRAALRWSLSKLRGALGAGIIEADRQRVAVADGALDVDLTALRTVVERGVGDATTAELERLASAARGEFLEDIELPDEFAFQAWLIAHRESARTWRSTMLAELVARLRDDPQRALPHARARTRADSLSVSAHVDLLAVLVAADRSEEAEQQYDLTRRFLQDAGHDTAGLTRAWRALRGAGGATSASTPVAAPAPTGPARSRTELGADGGRPAGSGPLVGEPGRGAGSATATTPAPFVGRRDELEALRRLLEDVVDGRAQRVVVLRGEPGAGKSRLTSELARLARERGVDVLAGRAFEAESSRPFGPWVDALGAAAAGLVHDGDSGPGSREELFGVVASAVAGRAAAADVGGAVLLLDDVQWLDRDSAELLHVVVRTTRDHPVLVVLAARGGELHDNDAATTMLRGIGREARVVDLELGPLGPEDIAALVRGVGDVDPTAVHEASAGNPLYALELARAGDVTGGASSLFSLVQDRVDRLPPRAGDVVRWAAVLGFEVDLDTLQALAGLPPRELVEVLEQLEQRDLLRVTEQGEYSFAHDVVRQAIHASVSHPRRRLMHAQVARLLEPRSDDLDVATAVAHHARLAGDAEVGVRACITAARRSLRLFANADAEALALRGLDLVPELPREEDRIEASLDLLQVQFQARTPDREQAAAQVEALAARALDLGLTNPARLGFQMLSFLRWESSSMVDAHENILQAERVSRSAASGDRAAALGHAARCLVLLERNLGQAEAFVREAAQLSSRTGSTLSSVQFAMAMLHEHRGELEDAEASFRDARWSGREHGDRLAEFRAIEHWAMLELDRGDVEQARVLTEELVRLGERVREGAEGPTGRALHALAALVGGDTDAMPALDDACADLRRVDAKYPLAFVLTRLARHELAGAGDGAVARPVGELAQEHATAGLELADAIGRRSDVVLARLLLLRCAEALGDVAAVAELTEELRGADGDLSASVREALAATLARVAAGT